MTLPPIVQKIYNQQKNGYFGELGSGAYARIRFLQSAITKDELDNITLIENIIGSERWQLRDIFQRDVDVERVEKSILPYLTDPKNVKFFNPLTLVLLPISDSTGAVDARVPYVAPVTLPKDGHDYTRYERNGLYCFDVHKQQPAYSELHWNALKVKLVAIDGQHRLSALMRWKRMLGPKDLDDWQIPVVILGVFRADNLDDHQPANLLEIVRKTFVYINTRAEEVNEARRILLDDEDLQAVCTQEVMQASHTNDCLPNSQKDRAKLPLLFFDWRGQVKWREDDGESVDVKAPGSVLSIVEIYQWLGAYVLADKPASALQLEDLDPPFSESFVDRGVLTNQDTVRVRKQFLDVLYPGLSYLLERFVPFQTYVKTIRDFEDLECASHPVNAVYAFQKLRFGSHPEIHGQDLDLVNSKYATIVDQLATMRNDCFDDLIDRDIGKRAVVYSFAELKKFRDACAQQTGDWKEHAEWYVKRVNAVYQAGWFKKHADLEKEQSKLLTHICFDPAGSIINYKLGDVPKAIGSFLALLVVSQELSEFSAEQQVDLWDKYGDGLDTTLRKGFRREQRARLKDTFQGTSAEFTAQVHKDADKLVIERLKRIRNKVMGSGA